MHVKRGLYRSTNACEACGISGTFFLQQKKGMFVGLKILWVPGTVVIARKSSSNSSTLVKERKNPTIVKAPKKLSKTKVVVVAVTGLAVVGAVAAVATLATAGNAAGTAAATGAVGVEKGYVLNQRIFQIALNTHNNLQNDNFLN